MKERASASDDDDGGDGSDDSGGGRARKKKKSPAKKKGGKGAAAAEEGELSSDNSAKEFDDGLDDDLIGDAEDRAKLAQVQRGLGSRFASIGPLGPPDYEGTIWDFYQFLARRLRTGRVGTGQESAA